jgi:hypothetical protein
MSLLDAMATQISFCDSFRGQSYRAIWLEIESRAVTTYQTMRCKLQVYIQENQQFSFVLMYGSVGKLKI